MGECFVLKKVNLLNLTPLGTSLPPGLGSEFSFLLDRGSRKGRKTFLRGVEWVTGAAILRSSMSEDDATTNRCCFVTITILRPKNARAWEPPPWLGSEFSFPLDRGSRNGRETFLRGDEWVTGACEYAPWVAEEA